MALYAIGDTHLSLSSGKPMDVFGGGWTGYVDKLKEGFSQIRPEDTVVLCGDLSWAMGLEEAREDFAFLNALPGKKLLMKGNHDYWWNTAAKMERSSRKDLPPSICSTITAISMGTSPCAGPGDGFMRRTGRGTAPRFSTGS